MKQVPTPTKSACSVSEPQATLDSVVEVPSPSPRRESSLPDRQPDEPPLTPTQHEDEPPAPEEAATLVEGDDEVQEDHGNTGGEKIYDIKDQSAPKPQVGAHTLTASAIRGRIRRVFTRKMDGSAKVSEAIFQEYQAGGTGKKTLEDIFRRCGYDPVT